MDVINSLYKTKVDVRVSHKTHSHRRYLYSTEKRTCPGIQPKIDKDSRQILICPIGTQIYLLLGKFKVVSKKPGFWFDG